MHEDHGCPIVAVNVWYHVGSKNEKPGRTGFAHLFEHLMFEGSQHYDRGYFHPLQEAGASAQRLDERRPHELLGSRADATRWSWRCGWSRIGWDTCCRR